MYSRRAYSTACPSKLLHQGTFHGRPDSRCMLASQMFSVQLQLNWNIKTIAVLMLDPCSDLGKITDGNITPCTLREDSSRNHPVFWSWPKHTKIFSVDTFMGVIVIFIASPACMQHAALLLSGAVIHICRPICYGWDSVSSVCLIVSMNLYISTYFITTSWVILWVSNQLVGFEYPFVMCVCACMCEGTPLQRVYGLETLKHYSYAIPNVLSHRHEGKVASFTVSTVSNANSYVGRA